MGELIFVNGHHLLVEARGDESGLPVVLLHHGLGTVYSWKQQFPALVDAGYYTIAYDRWGYGGSNKREQLSMPFFTEDLADLEALLAALGIGEASLIGHSDGGTIGLYFAASHPEKVRSLVTIAAHIYIEPKMGEGIEAVRRDFQKESRFQEGMRRIHGEKADAVFQGWYGGWRKPEHLQWDMRPLLNKVACPTLVVQGLEDEHATPKHAEDLAAGVPQAELLLVPGAGHMLPQEHAEDFNRRLLSFLEQYARKS